MIPAIHKLRYLLATRAELLTRVCLVVVLVGTLGTGVTFANPPMTEVPSGESKPISMSLHTQATVERESSFYSRGDVLVDMPVYLRSYTPSATVSLVTTPPADTPVRIDHRLTLVYEASTSRDEVFVRQQQRLLRTNTSTSGATVVSNATLNITAVARKVAQLESEIDGAGQVRVYLVAESGYATPTATGTLSRREPIRLTDSTYGIEHTSVDDVIRPAERTVQVDASKTVPLSLPIIGTVVVPVTTLVFALVGIGGLVGVGTTVAFGDRFDSNRERAALHKARYAEWISEGSLPAGYALDTIRLDTLEGLVDVAIDNEKRIVYDSSKGRYAVVDSHVVYLYVEDSV
ncbi:DUF5305 family protein [Haloferax sp. ATB1]|uniref:DUF5305 family protein n=1 Tax=Haloferax sp. ATB1 TaxID=1508454 RepID=UPI0005B1E049|nr:DUF5305 family protein [Haloferax sp. ATB1]